MSSSDPIEDLARLAHELWRRRMLGRGWTQGPRYCEPARTHDALVPYEQLPPRDKAEARLCVEARGFTDTLADAIEYPRGPERPLTIEEMRPGLPVTYAADIAVEQGKPPGPPERGEVESWQTDPVTGELTSVRVRWEDGSLSDHAPWAQELRRLE